MARSAIHEMKYSTQPSVASFIRWQVLCYGLRTGQWGHLLMRADLQNCSNNFAPLSLPTPSCAIMPEFRKVNTLPRTQNQLSFRDGDSDRISNQ